MATNTTPKRSPLGKRQRGSSSSSASPVKKLEFKQLSLIDEETDGYNATVYGIISSISPVKNKDIQGKKPYFHGYIQDSCKKIGFAGFEEDVQQKIEVLKGHPVRIAGCKVARNKYYGSGEPEIQVGRYANVSETKEEYDIDDTLDLEEQQQVDDTGKEIHVREIETEKPQQKVSLKACVIWQMRLRLFPMGENFKTL